MKCSYLAGGTHFCDDRYEGVSKTDGRGVNFGSNLVDVIYD